VTRQVPCLSSALVPGTVTRQQRDARSLGLVLFDRLDAHDFEGAAALFAADAKLELDPAGIAGTFAQHGVQFFRDLIDAFPNLRVRVRSVMGNPATAVVETTLQGTQGADFLGIRNRGRDLHIDQAWVISASQEKIVGMRGYWCQCQLYRRLGRTRLDEDSTTPE
jgi:predicted ester cyclase